MREEIRDLKLCLQSADKELSEMKKESKELATEKDRKIGDLFLRVRRREMIILEIPSNFGQNFYSFFLSTQIGSLEQDMASKVSVHERTSEQLHSIQVPEIKPFF